MNYHLLPTEWLIIAYLIVISLLLLRFRQRVSEWVLCIVAHVAVISAVLVSGLVANGLSPLLQILRDWYPLVLILVFYWEVGLYTQMAVQGYRDDRVIRLEGKIFKGQPSIYFSSRFESLRLSEFLHFCYLLYYAIIILLALPLYLQGRREAFHELIFAELLVSTASFVWFIFLPVAGPRYYFERISGHRSRGFFYKVTHYLLSRGSSKGTALPSLHASQTTIVLLYSLHYDLLYFSILLPLCIGILLSTIYGHFHYAVDVLAGVFLACAAFFAANFIYSLV